MAKMTEHQIEKLLSRLPFSDGKTRRRFVAGTFIASAVFYLNWAQVSAGLANFSDGSSMGFLSSTVVIAAISITAYSIGSVVEVIGEASFVRAASALLWALSHPKRHKKRYYDKSRWKRWLKFSSAHLLSLYYAARAFVPGLLGVSAYRAKFSMPAPSNMPYKVVKTGLRSPFGENFEAAINMLRNNFDSPEDKQWVSTLLSRVFDVAITITSILLVMLYALFARSNVVEVTNDPEYFRLTSELLVELSTSDENAEEHFRQLNHRLIGKTEFSVTMTAFAADSSARSIVRNQIDFGRPISTELFRHSSNLLQTAQDRIESKRESLSWELGDITERNYENKSEMTPYLRLAKDQREEKREILISEFKRALTNIRLLQSNLDNRMRINRYAFGLVDDIERRRGQLVRNFWAVRALVLFVTLPFFLLLYRAFFISYANAINAALIALQIHDNRKKEV